MQQKNLPTTKENKMYTPVGVQRLFKDAVDGENGVVEAIFKNQNKYRQLVELWYASAPTLLLNKIRQR